jgi:monovalent cation:H+ antiporter, CPA1 family
MTWAGLRGAIPVALALSLPTGEGRDLVVTITYVVVVFSVLVQGGTVKYLVPRSGSDRPSPASQPPKEI